MSADSSMPADYSAALEEIAPGITGIVADQTVTDESWYDALLRSIPQITATVQQRQIMLAQIDRAKAGLPPLDPNATVGVSVNTQNVLLLGALGLGALLLLKRSR